MIVKYNLEDRYLQYWDGDRLVSEKHIEQVYRENFRGENLCDWEVVRRMGLRNHQDRVEVWMYNPWSKRWYLCEYLYTTKIDGKIHLERTGENGFDYK